MSSTATTTMQSKPITMSQNRSREKAYHMNRDAQEFRVKHGNSPEMNAWATAGFTIAKETAQAAAEADALRATTSTANIQAPATQDTWVQRQEGSTTSAGRAITQVLGRNGEAIAPAPYFIDQYVSLFSANGELKPVDFTSENKDGVNGISMWMSEASAYLSGQSFPSYGADVPSIWYTLPKLFSSSKELIIVLDTFTMSTPKHTKLEEISGHRISKLEKERMEEITASFAQRGFAGKIKVTFKVVVNEAGERDESI